MCTLLIEEANIIYYDKINIILNNVIRIIDLKLNKEIIILYLYYLFII